MMFQPFSELNSFSLPDSVEKVVEILFNDLSLRERVIMGQLSESELDAEIYLAMAKTVRREFGLHKGNTDLLRSCYGYMGKDYDQYEDPAMVIIKELWKKIRKKHNLQLVKG